MTGRILVSVDALSGLVGRLRTVSSELGSAGQGATSAAGSRSPDLEGALDDFHSSWGKKRAELADDISKAAAALQNSMDGFTQADGALADAVNGGAR